MERIERPDVNLYDDKEDYIRDLAEWREACDKAILDRCIDMAQEMVDMLKESTFIINRMREELKR